MSEDVLDLPRREPMCQACEENPVTPPYTVCVDCAADTGLGDFLGWDDSEGMDDDD